MKALLRTALLISVLMMTESCVTYTPGYSYGPDGSVSLDVFYSSLSPYGMWVDYSRYGYVWIPNVSAGFTPYLTSGHWVYTNYGWTWYSYYSWGWAPFHYGRWYYDNAYGWMWVPDTTWGPAWVAWSEGNGYYGWAPLSPGISVNVAVSSELRIPRERWVFVHERDLTRNRIERYKVKDSRNMELLTRSQLVREVRRGESTTYLPGPERTKIDKRTRKSIREVPVVQKVRPGNGRLHSDRLEMFKPDVGKGRTKHRPDKVFDLKEARERQQHFRNNSQRNQNWQQLQRQNKDNSMKNNRDRGNSQGKGRNKRGGN